MKNAKRSLIGLALAASLGAVAQSAQAQLYWRADLGYSVAADAGLRDKNFATDGLICGDAACNSGGELKDIGNSPVLSAGVGWRIDPNWRADVTLAYRGGYKLDDADALPSNYKADITSTNLMLAGYYDFNAGWGRPYLGAGIGFASNKIDSVVNSGGALGSTTVTVPGGTKTGFAWSLMAGVGFPLNPSLTLDLGYRYVDLGKIESDSGAISCAPVACPGFTYSGMTGNLRAHELTVGLRF